jgi:ATP-dependent DNA helicase RecQ
VRPSSPARLLAIHGIGEKKSAEYGADMLREIADYCRQTDIALDAARPPMPVARPAVSASRTKGQSVSASKSLALELFAQGKSTDEVQAATGRARSTVAGYLVDFIEREGACDPEPWLTAADYKRIRAAAAEVGTETLRPIYDALEGKFDYERIRVAIACMRSEGYVHAESETCE